MRSTKAGHRRRVDAQDPSDRAPIEQLARRVGVALTEGDAAAAVRDLDPAVVGRGGGAEAYAARLQHVLDTGPEVAFSLVVDQAGRAGEQLHATLLLAGADEFEHQFVTVGSIQAVVRDLGDRWVLDADVTRADYEPEWRLDRAELRAMHDLPMDAPLAQLAYGVRGWDGPISFGGRTGRSVPMRGLDLIHGEWMLPSPGVPRIAVSTGDHAREQDLVVMAMWLAIPEGEVGDLDVEALVRPLAEQARTVELDVAGAVRRFRLLDARDWWVATSGDEGVPVSIVGHSVDVDGIELVGVDPERYVDSWIDSMTAGHPGDGDAGVRGAMLRNAGSTRLAIGERIAEDVLTEFAEAFVDRAEGMSVAAYARVTADAVLDRHGGAEGFAAALDEVLEQRPIARLAEFEPARVDGHRVVLRAELVQPGVHPLDRWHDLAFELEGGEPVIATDLVALLGRTKPSWLAGS